MFILRYIRRSDCAADDRDTDPEAATRLVPRTRARDRLLHAASEVAAHEGYALLTVERVLLAAGVSRATFYQYFTNIEDCFWSAYRQHSERLVSDVTAAVRGAERRDLAMLDALVDAAISRPDVARLLMTEGLAGGQIGLAERDALVAAIERAVDAPAGGRSAVDIPEAILIGGVFRFLSMRLADGGALDGVREEVREWAGAFGRSSPEHSWAARFMPVLPSSSDAPVSARAVRQRGTSRERILCATAASVREKGYRAMTVSDIVEGAGVSRRLFYNEFPSKSAAFMAAFEDIFQRTIAACTPAFFSSRGWPERVWQSALAFTNFVSREPLLAYLGFVECYAIGPSFAARVHDTQLAFALFLEEGYRQRPEAASLPRSCAALTVAAIVETGFLGSRRGVSLHLRRLQPLAVYVALTPFIGTDEAGRFVTGKLAVQAPAVPSGGLS